MCGITNLKTKHMKNFSLKEHFIYIFALFVTASTFAFDLMLSFHEIPVSNKDIVNMIAGVLNTSCLVVVVGYFYSSTANSKERQKQLIELAASKEPEKKV